MNLDEIVDRGTWQLTMQKWPLVLLAITLALIVSIATWAVLPAEYHITATVVGTRYQSDITPSNQTNSFSAAALLGANANDLPAITDFRLYIELLQSPELGALIVNDPVMHRIFHKSWKTDHWAPPDTISQHVANLLYPLAGRPAWHPPDGFTVADYLKSHISVVPGKDAKIAVISTWNKDPQLGRDLIVLVSSRADGMVRDMAQKRFKAKVAFLDEALGKATVQETRTAMGTTLARAETDEIFSLSTLPFAAEFVSYPDSPAEPGSPEFLIILLVVAVAAAFALLSYILTIKRRRLPLAQTIVVANRGRGGADVETAVP